MYDGEVLSLGDNHFLLLSYVSFILLYTFQSKSVPFPVPRLKIGLIIFILVFQFILRFCAHSNMPPWESIFLPEFPIILHNSIVKFCLHRWPLVPKFAGSNPAEAVGFLGRKKSSARLPSEGK